MFQHTYQKISEELLAFLTSSPTPFHAAYNMSQILQQNGYAPLHENERWQLTPGHGYFVTRNDSALIAFYIPEGGIAGWRIMASHSDSPSFKIKENPEITVENHYVQLNVEGYGGMIHSSWLDRPLSVAGRVVIRDPGSQGGAGDQGVPAIQGDQGVPAIPGGRNGLVTRLINLDRDLVLIPNLAIHMNREINKGYQYNPQKDLLPLYGDITAKGTFMKTIAQAAGCPEDDILGHDLFLYNRQPASIWGASGEFISSGRLDDLQCAYASLKGFLAGDKQKYAAICCVFDNEEVGSTSKQGAAGTFLRDTMERITAALSMSREDQLMAVANSFLVSADNAHAVHPNHTEKADPTNRPYINEGIVIKYNADQKYCTDAVSAAMFKSICMEAGVPYQTFTNRSDMAGGSTLGNISNTQVSLKAIDIGLPQLAMHSPYETAGIKDTAYLVQAAAKLFA